MNTITLDFEKLAEAMVVSFKYNTKGEHRGAFSYAEHDCWQWRYV